MEILVPEGSLDTTEAAFLAGTPCPDEPRRLPRTQSVTDLWAPLPWARPPPYVRRARASGWPRGNLPFHGAPQASGVPGPVLPHRPWYCSCFIPVYCGLPILQIYRGVVRASVWEGRVRSRRGPVTSVIREGWSQNSVGRLTRIEKALAFSYSNSQ